jgi:hypothetical protein
MKRDIGVRQPLEGALRYLIGGIAKRNSPYCNVTSAAIAAALTLFALARAIRLLDLPRLA